MTNKLENQSQNQLKDKKIDSVKIIESLIKFHTSLKTLNSAFEELFEVLNADSAKLQELQDKLKRKKVLYSIEEAQDHLSLIMFLAAFGQTQYIESDDLIVQVSHVNLS